MFVKHIEKISMLIKGKVMLVEGNIVDVSLVLFSIKNVHCKGGGKWIAKEITFGFNFKWCD